ncbi:MAG: proline--tRNA ligase [Mycoplasma sp.]
MNNKQNQAIVKRSESFSDWYTSVITASKLALYTDIKGGVIFQPRATKIWDLIRKELDQQFTKIGIQNVLLPTFIRYSEFMKEKEHVDGFAPEVFLVTHKGKEKLDDPLVVRPTSEVVFCDYFKRIVTSYNDLPVKFNQWCNVFRAEKTTRPFLRTTEFFWQELHSIHNNETEAKAMTQKMLDIYYDFATKFLLIPVIKGEKTVGERFAGAENTFTIEALMQDGQALQCGTSHYLGQNFAKTYDIKFTNKDNKFEHVYQVSAGVSTRIIGAIIMSHSDDKGLVLPFAVAPEQIAILEVLANKNPQVHEVAKQIAHDLKQYRVSIDTTDKSFGFKINEAEVSGVPFALILGPKDLETNTITLFRRDLVTKQTVNINDLKSLMPKLINEYNTNLFNKAKQNLDTRLIEVNNLEDFKKALSENKMIIAPWGGNIQDEKALKELTGATPRCIKSKIDKESKCFFTNKKATHLVYFARAY